MSSTWSATRRAASGLPSAALAAAMAARRSRSPISSATRRASSAPLELGVVDQERRAAGDHLPRVLALVVGGGVRVRHQDRRLAEGGELGDGAARARHDQIGRRHGGGQAVSVGHQAIPLKPLSAIVELAPHLVRVLRPAHVHQLEVELLAAEGVDAGRLMLWAPWLPPKASTTGISGCRSKASLPCSGVASSCPGLSGRPVTT